MLCLIIINKNIIIGVIPNDRVWQMPSSRHLPKIIRRNEHTQ